MPLAEDVSLRTYYPLSDEGYAAYEAWQKETGGMI